MKKTIITSLIRSLENRGQEITVREIGSHFVYNGNLYATYQVN